MPVLVDEYGNNVWSYLPEEGSTYFPFVEPPVGPGGRETNTAAAASSSSGGGGGGGGYGGGGGGSGVKEHCLQWFGYLPSGWEQWSTESEVRRAAVAQGADGPKMQQARQLVYQAAAGVYGDPNAVSESIVGSLIADGFWNDQTYLRNTYFPMLRDSGIDFSTAPASQQYVDAWIEMTGRPLTWTASNKLNEIVRQYGYTADGLSAWNEWVKTTDSAITGNWGATHRAEIESSYNSILGRAATPEELDPKGTVWNLNADARMEQIRQTPEYQAIYAGKPAYMTETDYLAYGRALSSVYTWYYGPQIDVTTLPATQAGTGNAAAIPQTPATPQQPATPAAPPQWKSLTVETFKSELSAVGITEQGGKYFKDGQEIAYADLINYLPAGKFWKDDRGYHYVQDAGAIDPSTGKAVSGPGVATTYAPPPVVPQYGTANTNPADLTRFGINNVTPEEVNAAIASGMSPTDIANAFKWHEEAIFQQGVYDPIMQEVFGSGFTHEQYEALARGGQGSGAMRVQLMEAQNRIAYRETYRQIFGNDPDPADYDAMTSQFVSPAEMLREHKATEDAKAMYPEINDLLTRVYGQGTSEAELKDMALGRVGSGDLRALISQAEKMDNFTPFFEKYHGRKPTPQEYAELAGYSDPSVFQWEIVTTEKVAELEDDINKAWNMAYGTDLSADDMFTMLGGMEGSGELLSQWKKAEEEMKRQETSTMGAHYADKTGIAYAKSATGGIQEAVPGLEEL